MPSFTPGRARRFDGHASSVLSSRRGHPGLQTGETRALGATAWDRRLRAVLLLGEKSLASFVGQGAVPQSTGRAGSGYTSPSGRPKAAFVKRRFGSAAAPWALGAFCQVTDARVGKNDDPEGPQEIGRSDRGNALVMRPFHYSASIGTWQRGTSFYLRTMW